MDYGRLAYTGPGLLVGGAALGVDQLVLVAVGMVAVGALGIRLGFRRGKAISE